MSVFNESCYQPIIDVVKLVCTKHSAESYKQDITETEDSSEGSSSWSDSESTLILKSTMQQLLIYLRMIYSRT